MQNSNAIPSAPLRFCFRRQVLLAACIVASLAGCRENGESAKIANPAKPAGNEAHFYSTTFSQTENPIREGGRWVGGSDAGASLWAGGRLWTGGRLWDNVQTASGMAYGVDEPTQFGDPTAILTGA